MTERSVFLEALDRGDPAERAAYLDTACAGKPELRKRIEELLRSHEEADTFLDVPAAEQMAAAEQSLAFLAPAREPGTLGRLDHYDILEIVGRGGSGVVLRAMDTKLKRIVAIKALAARLAASAPARQRFVREAQAVAAISDDHVVAIHAVSDDGPVPYLVMEYVSGMTLEERVKQGGPLELKETLRIGMQMAQGLAAAHAQGVVHRDIKPGNVLLENGVQRVKITDFGLARHDDGSVTPGTLAGTPQYMSPEQARGEPTDHRTDLFSLGSVLYALCAGHAPFRANTTAETMRRVREETPAPLGEGNSQVPVWLGELIANLHAKRASDRVGRARDVAELLGAQLSLLQQPPVLSAAKVPANLDSMHGAHVVPSQASSRRSAMNRPVQIFAALVVLIIIAVLLAILRPWERRVSDQNPEAVKPRRAHAQVQSLDLRHEQIGASL